MLDDFHNLSIIQLWGGIESRADVLRYAFGQDGKDFFRFVSRLSFLIDDQFWPSDSSTFKRTNILLHLISGLFLYLLLVRVFDSNKSGVGLEGYLPLCVTTLWLLLPSNVSTVLYVVQRMTILMALFSFASLYFYMISRESDSYCKKYFALGSSGFLAALAFFSKENGAQLLIFFPLLELYKKKSWQPLTLLMHRFIFIVFPLLFLLIFISANIVTFDTYLGRDFSLVERFLSQSRIIFDYSFISFSGFSDYTLFHDDISYNLSYSNVVLGVFLWIVHCVIVFFCWRRMLNGSVFGFGIIFFYFGHVIESTTIPLELMFEHRNYFPLVGLLISFCALLNAINNKIKKHLNFKDLGRVCAFFIPVYYILWLLYHVSMWDDSRILYSKWAADKPNSLRSQASFITMLESNGLEQMSVDTLGELIKSFDDYSLVLQRLILECKIGDDVSRIDPVVLKSIIFKSGVTHMLERMISYSDNWECYNENIDGGMDSLMLFVGKMPLLSSKPRYHARYLDVAGDYFVKAGNYELSVKSRELAVELQPTISTHLKLVELFLMGGDITRARKYLSAARDIHEDKWFYDKKEAMHVSRLENIVTLLLKNKL